METDHSSRSSRPILKLVHPGRFIEKYTKPITAAEVMRRHPRHCVARPDVFTNPWIVVRPESVLLPGNVFYVVSFHTLHRLMWSVRSPHKVEQISSSWTVYEGSGQSFADVADFRQLEKGQSRQDSSAEMPKLMKTAVVEQLIRKNTSKEGSFSQDMCRYFEESGKQIIKNGSFSAKQSDKSRINRTNYLVKHFDWSSIGNSFSSTDQRYRDGLNNATELKSCLKKSENKLVNLRVRFKLPGGEVKMSRTCRSHFEQHIRTPKNLNVF